MPLEIITNLITVDENMPIAKKINAQIANKTVENIAQALKDSPMNENDKGDRKIIYTITAHIDKPFTYETEIIPL